ncbi:MAG: hypothetical protein ABIZ04_21155 [Opitutus sp.]
MAAKRPNNENDYTRAALSHQIARIRSDAVVLDRFLSFAESEGQVDRARFLPRLRIIFSGRAAPAFIALLIQKFFASNSHLGVQREHIAGVCFRAPVAEMAFLKKFAFLHPAFDYVTEWMIAPGHQLHKGSIHAKVLKPSHNAEAAIKVGVSEKVAAKKMKAAQQWFSVELENWPDIYKADGEVRSIFYRFDDEYDPLDPSGDNPSSLDDLHDAGVYLWEACALIDAVARRQAFRLFRGKLYDHDFYDVAFLGETRDADRAEESLRGVFLDPSSSFLHRLLVFLAEGKLPEVVRADLVATLDTIRHKTRRLERALDDALLYSHEDTVRFTPPMLRADMLLARNEINKAIGEMCCSHTRVLAELFAPLVMQCATSGKERAEYTSPAIVESLNGVTTEELDAFLKDCSYPSSVLAVRSIRGALGHSKSAPRTRQNEEERGFSLKNMVLDLASKTGSTDLPHWLSEAGAYSISAELYAALRVEFDAVTELTSSTDYGVLKVRPRGSKSKFLVFDVKLESEVREKWDQREPEVLERIRRFVTVHRKRASGESLVIRPLSYNFSALKS